MMHTLGEHEISMRALSDQIGVIRATSEQQRAELHHLLEHVTPTVHNMSASVIGVCEGCGGELCIIVR
jgi:hypothetical protein